MSTTKGTLTVTNSYSLSVAAVSGMLSFLKTEMVLFFIFIYLFLIPLPFGFGKVSIHTAGIRRCGSGKRVCGIRPDPLAKR